MKKIFPFATVASLLILFSSCDTNRDFTNTAPPVTAGAFVLNEGTFFGNNTTLTYYQLSNNTATTDFWSAANGSGLGDTGNDMIIYGGKLYIVMNVSSTLEIANATTAVRIRQLDLKTPGGVKRQPRYVLPYQNKVLVSCYDGTVAVVDTMSLAIDRIINVGANPEQMVIVGNNLYVANSGGLNPVPDSTLSVVDLATMSETRKIKVGVNPGSVTADESGNIYIGCLGNFSSIPARLVKYSTSMNAVIKTADTAVGKIKYYNGLLYATGGYTGSPNLRTLSTVNFSETRPNWITDGTPVVTPYGITIDQPTGDVFLTDAKNFAVSGEVFCFDATGRKKYSFRTTPGISPNTVVLVKR